MHPDMAREIIRQRSSDLRSRARDGALARQARAAGRARRASEARHAVVVPPVPDYVDGTFAGAGDREHADA